MILVICLSRLCFPVLILQYPYTMMFLSLARSSFILARFALALYVVPFLTFVSFDTINLHQNSPKANTFNTIWQQVTFGTNKKCVITPAAVMYFLRPISSNKTDCIVHIVQYRMHYRYIVLCIIYYNYSITRSVQS